MEKVKEFFVKEKKFMLIIAVFLGIVIAWFVYEMRDRTAEYSYEEYSISRKYTKPEVKAKPAKYSEVKPINLFIGDTEIDENNDGKSDYKSVPVGKNLPAGDYKIKSLELDDYCSLYVKDDYEEDATSGEQYYEGDTVSLGEHQELVAWNCLTHNGGLKATLVPTERKLISEKVEAEPEKKVTETIKFTKDGRERAYVNGVEQTEDETKEMKMYNKLEKIKNEAKKEDYDNISSKKITEKLVKTSSGDETCYKNNKEVYCDELNYFNKLKVDLR